MKSTCTSSTVPEVLTDDVWERIRPLIPATREKKKTGRPRMDDRQALNAILYVQSTGCAWKSLPKEMGAPSTVHDRFLAWKRAGLLVQLTRRGLISSSVDQSKSQLNTT